MIYLSWLLRDILQAWFEPSKATNDRNQKTKRKHAPPDIVKLPSCVSEYLLTFLTAGECTKARLVNSSWQTMTKSPALWKDLCDIAEKPNLSQLDLQIGIVTNEERYKLHPTVPQDFKTIQSSINYLRGKNGRTILVSCGTYSEAITLEDIEVTIKAVKGEVVFQRSVNETDVPSVRIKSGIVKLVGINIVHGCKGIKKTIKYCSNHFSHRIFHYDLLIGLNIWNGNSAIMTSGPCGMNKYNKLLKHD